MFEQSFLPVPARTRRAWTVAVSFLSQIFGIGVLILVPLIVTDSLPKGRLQDLLFAPPPPPARPAPPAIKAMQVIGTERVPMRPNALFRPDFVPKQAQMIVDPPQVTTSVGQQGPSDGVIGGIPGIEAPSGMLHKVIEEANRAPQPPAPARVDRQPERPPQRVVMGGNVLEGKLLRKVTPVYPKIALQVRAAGVVRIAAVIGTDGRIRELRALSGHPLLVRAALDAVAQWVYQPTLLNGVPVEIDSTIDVTFTLQQ